VDNQVELLRRRLERERVARKQAERITEERSRELYTTIEQLQRTAAENARLFQEVERLSSIDPLTGLYNRRHFNAAAQVEFARAIRFGLKLAAMMMDIDHFKSVNDRFGHATGDAVLIGVARVCLAAIRLPDLHARYGGEEFCFLLPETDLAGAVTLAERLRAEVAGLRFEANDEGFGVTASVGVAEWQADTDSVEALLVRSDHALYQAKQSGRNRVVAWTSA
jgi:diguanylate cyclase (GGDEF)-like protein